MADVKHQGIIVEFSADTVQFNRSIDGVNRALKILQKDYSYFQKQLKNSPDGADGIRILKKEMDNLDQQIKVTRTGIELFRNRLRELENIPLAERTSKDEAEMKRLSVAIIDATNHVDALSNMLKTAKERLEEISSTAYAASKAFKAISEVTGNIGSGLMQLGNQLQFVSRGAGTALASLYNYASEFESAFIGVQKTVDETATTSYEQLERTFRQMAMEVPSTASEIANVAEMAGQLGIKADDIEAFTRTMIDLGNATNITATEGAAKVAQFFNIMGHTTGIKDIVDNFGAAVTELGNNSATTEWDIVQMAQGLASASHVIGLTDQEVLGLATTLSSLGLRAERGSSSLSTIMRKIETDVQNATEKGEGHLAAWGEMANTTAEGFRKLWQENPARALVEVVKGLANLGDGEENLYGVLDDVDISAIRQIDTITRLANGYERLDEYMEMANRAWEENTALTNEANRRYGSAESQMQILKNTVVDLALDIGESLLPSVKDFVQSAKPIVESMSDWAKQNGELVVEVLALTAALAPALKIVGGLFTGVSKLTGVIGTIFGTLAKGAGLIQAIVGAIGGGLTMGIAAAVVGLGALAYQWYDSNKETIALKKNISNLNNEMIRNGEISDANMLNRERELNLATAYSERIDSLLESLRDQNLSEEERQPIISKLGEYVNGLNAALGEEVYSLDAATGQLQRYGEACDSAVASNAELIGEMRKNAWLQSHQDEYNQSFEQLKEAQELKRQAEEMMMSSFAEADYKGITAPLELLSELQSKVFSGEMFNPGQIKEMLQNYDWGDIDISNFGIDKIADQLYSAVATYQQTMPNLDATISNLVEAQKEYEEVGTMNAEEFNSFLENNNGYLVQNTDNLLQAQLQLQRLKELRASATTDTEKSQLDAAIIEAQAQVTTIEQSLAAQEARQAELDQKVKDYQENFQDTTLFDDYFAQFETTSNTASDNGASYLETTYGTALDGTLAKGSDTMHGIADIWATMELIARDVFVTVHWIDGGFGEGGLSQNQLAGYAPNLIGGMNSGGFASGGYGNVTLETNINVNGAPSIAEVRRWSRVMLDELNQELGKRLR